MNNKNLFSLSQFSLLMYSKPEHTNMVQDGVTKNTVTNTPYINKKQCDTNVISLFFGVELTFKYFYLSVSP